MPRQYKAFISYSWADKDWGSWLHRTLELYRPPSALVGKETPIGPVPRRLHPIFKDREEEAAGYGIGASIEAALDNSEFLIVLCSTTSAKSKWVNREIAYFKTHKDPKKILAVVIDGEPGASTLPGREDEECFPRALTHRVGPDLLPTDEIEDVPLAADARKTGDGKRRAKLKLAAALIGVGLDDLVRRDDRRRAIRRRWVTGGMTGIAIVMTALALAAMQARDVAQSQRAQAEGLVEYMIGDLRNKLQQEVQLKVLANIASRADEYYSVQSSLGMDDDALARRARVLDLLAAIKQDLGDTDAAMRLSLEAIQYSERLLARDPDNPDRLVDHAHFVQGLGNLAVSLDDLPLAEIQMRKAVSLLETLIELEPSNEDWKAEQGAALANFGIVQLQNRHDEQAIETLNRARRTLSASLSGSHDPRQTRQELAVTLSWLVEAYLSIGEDTVASNLRREIDEIYTQLLKENPDDKITLSDQLINQLKAGEALLNADDVQDAKSVIDQVSGGLAALVANDPEDTYLMGYGVRLEIAKARIALKESEIALARQALNRANTLVDELVADDAERTDWNGILLGNVRLLSIVVAAKDTEHTSNCIRELGAAPDEFNRLERLSLEQPTDRKLALVTARAALISADYASVSGSQERAEHFWNRAIASLNRSASAEGKLTDSESRNLYQFLQSQSKGKPENLCTERRYLGGY